MAKPIFVTPKGTAAYAWLTKPDTKFNPEGVYKTSLVVPAKEAEKFIEAIKNAYVEELGAKKLAKANLSHEVNEDDTVTFKFKSKSKPKLFDSKGKPITKEISVGNGSVIKVAGGFGPYDKGANTGVALYLNSVQIIDLVEWTGSSAFGEEQGGFVAGDDDSTAEVAESSDF
jgi:hypothetical protein